MDIYQHNIELLKENRPKLYELYQKAVAKKEYKYPCEHIQQAGARDGSVIFTVTRDGIEKRLNSPYHPLKEAERWASQFHGNNVMVNAMLFGFGNGMFAGALLNLLKEDAKLFVYEPNLEIFNMAMKYIDLQDIILDDRVLLFWKTSIQRSLRDCFGRIPTGQIWKRRSAVIIQDMRSCFRRRTGIF